MTDTMDQAQGFEQMRRDQALNARRRQATGPGRDDCLDCDEKIPPARRAAHPAAERCEFCQSQWEAGQ
ncbi:MAG: molecular chaperone DnaK [Rhodospirillales bacterium CG15_BIG_FIL_POST_REV_8_21_14_020_66_15]|nr:MAG: molecular chaperone DnaK [Rhodospirillales bacterium CG15_BIG_FIL_POST_REV_8_21_14_020_66_15]